MSRRKRTAILSIVLLLSALLASTSRAQVADSDSSRDQPGDFVINRPAGLYAEPSAEAHIIRRLRPRTVVSVVEVREQWYKVHSTTGHEDGWVRRSYADPFRGGGKTAAHGRRFRVGTFKLTDPVIVREQPDMAARKLATLRAGAEVRVIDKDPSGLWYKIESETGRPPGWIPTQAAKRLEAAR